MIKKTFPKDYLLIKDAPYIYLDTDTFTGDINLVNKKILDIKNQLREAIKEINANNKDDDNSISITPISKYALIKIECDTSSNSIDWSLRCYRLKTEEEKAKEVKDKRKRSIAAQKAKKEKIKKQQDSEIETLKKLKKKYPNF